MRRIQKWKVDMGGDYKRLRLKIIGGRGAAILD
jgi:hypothetical protein